MIIKGQAYIRGYLTRKHYRQLSEFFSSSSLPFIYYEYIVAELKLTPPLLSTETVFVESPLRKRNDCFREIFKRENIYVNNLRVVVLVCISRALTHALTLCVYQRYLMPLKENMKGYRALISEKEVVTIFSNVEGLLTVHEGMLQQFEIIQARWPNVDGIGDVFLTMVSNYLF